MSKNKVKSQKRENVTHLNLGLMKIRLGSTSKKSRAFETIEFGFLLSELHWAFEL